MGESRRVVVREADVAFRGIVKFLFRMAIRRGTLTMPIVLESGRWEVVVGCLHSWDLHS